MKDQEVTYFKSKEIGKGLPFALTLPHELVQTDDIFLPSLRDFHVIFWVKKGKGAYYVDFQRFEFEENTLILLSKDQLHYFEKYDPSKTEVMSIVFSPDFIYKNDSDLNHLFRFYSNAHVHSTQQLPVSESIGEKMKMYTSEMHVIYNGWDSVYQSKAFYHWLCLFLIQCEMLQEANSVNELPLSADLQLVLAFNSLLEENFKTEFKVDFYADQLNIPVKALVKLTKDHFKKSPKAVIDERRILEIKRQIRGTNKSGKTIAYELNFGEPTNMFKYFKKHVGLTPAEFKAEEE